MPRRRALLLLLASALCVLALDWGTKALAPALAGDLAITNDKEPWLWALAPALCACTAVALLAPCRLVATACGLLAGGWLGNVAGRALFGPVVDFVPLPFGYVGNLADLTLLAGGALLSLWLARGAWLRLRGVPFAFTR